MKMLLSITVSGPGSYSDLYGNETTVVKMHSGNGEHEKIEFLAIACLDLALDDVGLADNSGLRKVLLDYFVRAATTTMSRYHQCTDDVPDSLLIPHWS